MPEETEAFAAQALQSFTIITSHAGAKDYVQDLLHENRNRLFSLVENGATIYICGDASQMEPDVRRHRSPIYLQQQARS